MAGPKGRAGAALCCAVRRGGAAALALALPPSLPPARRPGLLRAERHALTQAVGRGGRPGEACKGR